MRWLRDSTLALTRSPVLALAAMMCIALGSAAATAIATLVDATLLRPVPFPEPHRLARVWFEDTGGDNRTSLSIAEARDLLSMQLFDRLLITARVRTIVLLSDGAERLRGEAVNNRYFETLGIRAEHGRLFQAADHAPGATPTIVLSYGTWMRGFGGDTKVVGRTLRTERAAYTVIGVAPRSFIGTVEQDVVDFWTPLDHYEPASMIQDRSARQTWTIARLHANQSLPAAQAELDAVQKLWNTLHPNLYRQRHLRIEWFGESWRQEYRRGIGVMAGAAVVLLAIASINVGCLLVARVLQRRRELAVRAVLGASGRNLALLLLTEALIVVVGGGLAGLLIGPSVLEVFLAMSPVVLPSYVDLAPNVRSVALALGTLAFSGLLAGTVPATLGFRVSPGDILRASGRGTFGSAVERRWVGILVGVEVALTLTLLVSGALLLRAFERFTDFDLGFRREGIARLAVTSSRTDAADGPSRLQLFERIRDAVARYPGVDRAGLVAVTLPPWNAYRVRVRFRGLDVNTAPDGLDVGIHMSDHEFFPALGVRMVEGRNFSAADRDRVAIVSRSLAHRMGGAFRAVGSDIEFPNPEMNMPSGRFRVIGVAEDVAYDGFGEQGTGRHIHYAAPEDAGARLDVYVPLALFPLNTVSIAAYTRGNEAELIEPLRREIGRLAPASAVHWTSTMAEEVGTEYAPTRFYAVLTATFSGSALALTSLGLFALLSNAATRRSSEMGLRLALGASPRQVALLLLRGGLAPLAGGVAGGIVGAVWASASMRSLLYDVGRFDLLAFSGALTALLLVTVAASLLPARRVALVDPGSVIKGD